MSDLVLRVAAKALIRHDDKLLLLREVAEDGTQIGKYQIPGGMVEPGEQYMEALLREAEEETGLKVNPLMPIMVDGWFPVIDGVKHQIIAIFYLCESDSTEIKLSHEHDKYAWVSPEEINDYDVVHPVPQLFQQYKELSRKNRSGL